MYHDYLILGGAGLVGTQVVRHVVGNLSPRRIVIASLHRHEAEAACEAHRAEFGDDVRFLPAWGDLFLPYDMAETPRSELLADPASRRRLLEALYGDFDAAYRDNHLVRLVRQHRPDVIVDAVNTATGLSYQDVFDGAARVLEWIGEEGVPPEGLQDLETFLLSQSVPQIIRHVRMLARVTTEMKTRVVIKVGTTGTGGMGLNIPYTHSEDRPSKKLLAKTEAAFGHTGLLFLFARTPGAPVVKEVKPAAMIGYRAVEVRDVSDRAGNRALLRPRRTALEPGGSLPLRLDPDGWEQVGTLRMPVVDTGENGQFTRGEFAAITALGQMEYITPEEIASTIVMEIRGANSGKDVISNLDGAVLNPSYKAGLVRNVALRDLADAEDEAIRTGDGMRSIALGRLGPPELSKLLFEASLLRETYGDMDGILADQRPAAEAVEDLVAALERAGVLPMAPSIGIPVLLPDGRTLLRGPRINVPELLGHSTEVPVTVEAIDTWARKGWVDLRPVNLERWRERARRMARSRSHLRRAGSAAADIRSYIADGFEPGEVVAWIFNNEMDGYRVK